MKNLILVLIFTITAVSAICQCRNPRVKGGESGFIADFALTDGSGATSALLDEVAKGKIDDIEGGASPETRVEYRGRVFLTRRWSEEIAKFSPGFSGHDLDIGIKKVIEARLTKCGFEFKPGLSYVGLSSIDYKKGATIGSVDLRTIYDEKGNLHLYFIFNESFLKTAR